MLSIKFYNYHMSLMKKIFLLVSTFIISKNKEQNVKGLFLQNELMTHEFKDL
jgi:hypothetical protein